MGVVHGLRVRCDAPLRGPWVDVDAGAEPRDAEPDVHIEFGEVPTRLESPSHRRLLWQADRQRFLLKLPGSGRLLVERGRRIRVHVAPGAEPGAEPAAKLDALVALVWNEAWFALLAQRGCRPIHACVVAGPSSAIALLGAVGCGKSALGAALVQRGLRLLCDRFCVVQRETLAGVVTLQALPGFRRFTLWPDTVGALGLGGRVRAPARAGLPPLLVDATACADTPLPLRHAFQLGRRPDDRLQTQTMTPHERRVAWWRYGVLDEAVGLAVGEPSDAAVASYADPAMLAEQVSHHRLLFRPGAHGVDELAERIADFLV